VAPASGLGNFPLPAAPAPCRWRWRSTYGGESRTLANLAVAPDNKTF